MPLSPRAIAVSTAVICFFALAILGWFSGLMPATCCKRAVLGALFAYAVVALIVKVINAALMDAIVTREITKQKEMYGGGTKH